MGHLQAQTPLTKWLVVDEHMHTHVGTFVASEYRFFFIICRIQEPLIASSCNSSSLQFTFKNSAWILTSVVHNQLKDMFKSLI